MAPSWMWRCENRCCSLICNSIEIKALVQLIVSSYNYYLRVFKKFARKEIVNWVSRLSLGCHVCYRNSTSTKDSTCRSLSPGTIVKILFTGLHTFHWVLNLENLFKQDNSSLVIISLILMTCICVNALTWWGEIGARRGKDSWCKCNIKFASHIGMKINVVPCKYSLIQSTEYTLRECLIRSAQQTFVHLRLIFHWR